MGQWAAKGPRARNAWTWSQWENLQPGFEGPPPALSSQPRSKPFAVSPSRRRLGFDLQGTGREIVNLSKRNNKLAGSTRSQEPLITVSCSLW